MAATNEDVKTETDSSTVSDVNEQDSSTAQQDVNNTVDKEVDAAIDEFATENKGDESSEEASGEEEEAADQQNEQQSLDETQQAKHEEAVPYARFNEVNTKYTDLEKEYNNVKPLVEQQRAVDNIMRQYNISPQEFQSWIQYGINLRTNPQAALAQIEPIYQRLAQLEGKILPQDLEAEVAAGTLARERAVEIAKGRAQSQYGQVQQQWSQNGQQTNNAAIVQGTIGQWVQTKTRLDADLKEGSPLWEQTNLYLQAMPVAVDANDAWQKCEQAYGKAKKFLQGFQPRTQTPRRAPLQSRQTNQSNGTSAPKTMDEAIKGFISSSRRPNALR